MKLRNYTVYDTKTGSYHPPFFATTDGAAIRSFQDVANDTQTLIGRHPLDYSLWFCGEFDDTTGQITPNIPLSWIADARSLVVQQPALPLTGTSQE